MAIFWKQSNFTARKKILVYDSVIRSKLLYGLESAELRPSDLSKLDTFQLKGLRQILKLKTTYSTVKNEEGQIIPKILRENTNKRVYEIANEKLQESASANPKTKLKTIKKLSEYYEERKCILIEKLINSPQFDTVARTTFNPITLAPYFHGRKRRGRPNIQWADNALKTYWQNIHHLLPVGTDTIFDQKDQNHLTLIKNASSQFYFSSPPQGG